MAASFCARSIRLRDKFPILFREFLINNKAVAKKSGHGTSFGVWIAIDFPGVTDNMWHGETERCWAEDGLGEKLAGTRARGGKIKCVTSDNKTYAQCLFSSRIPERARPTVVTPLHRNLRTLQAEVRTFQPEMRTFHWMTRYADDFQGHRNLRIYYADRRSEVCTTISAGSPNPYFAPNIYIPPCVSVGVCVCVWVSVCVCVCACVCVCVSVCMFACTCLQYMCRGVDLALWSHRWCQKVLCGVKSDFFGAR